MHDVMSYALRQMKVNFDDEAFRTSRSGPHDGGMLGAAMLRARSELKLDFTADDEGVTVRVERGSKKGEEEELSWSEFESLVSKIFDLPAPPPRLREKVQHGLQERRRSMRPVEMPSRAGLGGSLAGLY